MPFFNSVTEQKLSNQFKSAFSLFDFNSFKLCYNQVPGPINAFYSKEIFSKLPFTMTIFASFSGFYCWGEYSYYLFNYFQSLLYIYPYMSDLMKAPHVTGSKILPIGNKKFDLLQLEAQNNADLATSKDKSTSVAEKHVSCAQVHKGLLYLYDGVDTFNFLNMQKNTHFYALMKAQRQTCAKQFLLGYNLIGSAMLNNEVYMLGNRQMNSVVTNQMVKFNTQIGSYELIEFIGDKLQPREGALMESINNMYIVVYGGTYEKEKKTFSDAYMFIFKKWKKLQKINQIEPRFKFASSSWGSEIYMHGGQAIKDDTVIYYSEIYRLIVSDVDFKFQYELLEPKLGLLPSARSGHSMTSLSQRYILLFGGQFKQKMSENKMVTHHLKDCWVFDIFEREWCEIKLKSQNITFQRTFYVKSWENKVFIFGGSDSDSKKKLDLLRLQFPQHQAQQSLRKRDCQTNHEEQFNGHQFQMATSLMHSTSYSLRFAFQAVQRIIDYTQSVKAKYFRIHSQMTSNTIQKYIYISIQFDHEQIQSNTQDDLQLEKLPYYCLRLGKTMLYVQNNPLSFSRTVFLISVDGRFAPLVERMQIKYRYTQNTQNGLIKSHEQVRNKEIIMKILDSLVQNPTELIRSVKDSKIMIFSSNIIPTTKTYYYELVFDSPSDIGVFKNNKKVDFLQKIKYDLSSCMQFSLHSYLKYARSHSQKNMKSNSSTSLPRVYLSTSAEPVPQTISYTDYLHEFWKKQKLTKLEIKKQNLRFVQFVRLYACQQDFYLPQNNGILIYQAGRLVNRYQLDFGQLLTEKFYYKKYQKQNKNIFYLVGQIHVSDDLKLIDFRTQFQNTRNYLLFRVQLEKAVKSAILKFGIIIADNNVKTKHASSNNKSQKQQIQVPITQTKKPISSENSSQRKKINNNDNSLQIQNEQMNNESTKKVKTDFTAI